MGPQMVLILLFISVVVINVIVMMIRAKKFLRLEQEVYDFARSKGGAVTLEEISSRLGISHHDAKILMRKSVARGSARVEDRSGKEIYIVQKD
ncbi:MAG: hypothetical protein ACE5PM_08530 [Candidatus Hydrothermarchaeales archaeon]